MLVGHSSIPAGRSRRAQRLPSVVRVVGTPRSGASVELAMRGAQPALRDRRMGIDRTHVNHFAKIRREYTKDEEEIRVCSRRRNIHPGSERPGDFGLRFDRARQKVSPSPIASNDTAAAPLEGPRLSVPAGSQDRAWSSACGRSAIRSRDARQSDRRGAPAVALAAGGPTRWARLQIVTEETFLQVTP